jgi:hypothetical protein
MQPLINGTAYAWSQVELRIFNQAVAGVVDIKYDDMQQMQDNKGAGEFPVSRGYGNIEAKGTITLEMAEVEALQAAAPQGRINKIPEFDIVVSYLPEGGVIKTHTLHNCRFKGNKRELKSGDMTINVELELQVSHISWL